jgi:hypothetical protein
MTELSAYKLSPLLEGEFVPHALLGRVEDWRAGGPRHPGRATFPAPPSTSHVACRFPALRAPICFMPRLMGPIKPGRLSACRISLESC